MRYWDAPSQRTSRTLAAFGLFVGNFRSYKAAEAIIADDINSLVFAALLFVAGRLSSPFSMIGAEASMSSLPGSLRGFVRKYLGNNMALVFAKDALAIVLYISFFRAQHATKFENSAFHSESLCSCSSGLDCCRCLILLPEHFLRHPGNEDLFLVRATHLCRIRAHKVRGRSASFSPCLCTHSDCGCVGARTIDHRANFPESRTLQEDIRELGTLYRASPSRAWWRIDPLPCSSVRPLQDFLMVAWLISLGFSGYLLCEAGGRTLAFTTVGVLVQHH